MDKNIIEEYIDAISDAYTNKEYNLNSDTLRYIKSYMLYHPNDPDVIKAKTLLSFYLSNIYTDINLTNILDYNDLKYKKIIDYFKIDPLRIYTNLISLFNTTIFIPEGSYIENNINWFLKDMGYSHVDNLDKSLKFTKDFPIKGGKDPYGTFEEEKERYLNFQNGIKDNDYYNFVKDKKSSELCFNRYYEGDPDRDYLYKKLGNIGEYYTYNLLSEYNPIFVARDLGNGFGYDIYTVANIDNKTVELLIEVKSTSNPDKNYFSITDTEYKVLKDTLSNDKAEYIVCLVYVDVKNNIYKHVYYRPIDDKTFIEINGNRKYIFDNTDQYGNYIFKEKQKIMSI